MLIKSTLTHNRGPPNRPLCSVLKFRPDCMAVVCLRCIDRSHREPDDKNDDNNNVEDCSDFVYPANKFGALHSQKTL